MKKKKAYIMSVVTLLLILVMSVPVLAKTTIKMSDSSVSLDPKMSCRLSLIKWSGKYGSAISNKSIKWKSSNKKVATVTAGLVKTKAVGKTTITAKYKSKTYRCTVTVKKHKKITATGATNVTLTGKIKKITGYHVNGTKISNLIIQLSSPIHLIFKEDGTSNTMVKELDIFAPNLNVNKYVGKKVQIKGTLMRAQSAWYLRSMAICAKSIKRVK